MKVAVVYSALPAEGGGVFTFEDAMRRGLDQLGPASRHEFVEYTAGGDARGATPIPQTRRVRYARSARRQVVALQDRFEAPRLSWRTWFQRAPAAEGGEVRW